MRVTYCDAKPAKGLTFNRAGYCTTYHIADCGTANVPTKGPTPINQAKWVYKPGRTTLIKAPQLDAHVAAYRDASNTLTVKLSQLADRFGR